MPTNDRRGNCAHYILWCCVLFVPVIKPKRSNKKNQNTTTTSSSPSQSPPIMELRLTPIEYLQVWPSSSPLPLFMSYTLAPMHPFLNPRGCALVLMGMQVGNTARKALGILPSSSGRTDKVQNVGVGRGRERERSSCIRCAGRSCRGYDA